MSDRLESMVDVDVWPDDETRRRNPDVDQVKLPPDDRFVQMRNDLGRFWLLWVCAWPALLWISFHYPQFCDAMAGAFQHLMRWL